MKKYYEEPELEEISILTTDVIMTSPAGGEIDKELNGSFPDGWD